MSANTTKLKSYSKQATYLDNTYGLNIHTIEYSD